MAKPTDNLKINGERLWDSIHEMAKIGPGVRGGNNRQTLTDDDAKGRRLFQNWCEAAGMTIGVDEMGTMFARREGDGPRACRRSWSAATSTPSRPAAAMTACSACSAGWRSIRTLNDLGIKTSHPIEVVNWTNEEGTRFAPAMLASGVFAGVHDAGLRLWPQGRRRGSSFGDELERIGFKGEEPVGERKLQGVLRTAHRAGADPRGRGQGYRRRHPRPGPVVAAGDADRQGSPYRLDADAHARQRRPRHGAHHRDGPPHRHGASAGARSAPSARCDFYPNSRNVIPGKVVFTIDIRSPDQKTLDQHEGEDRGRKRRRSPRSSASASRSSRSAISIR